MSFIDPLFFYFVTLFILGAATLRERSRILFYTGMSYIFYSYAYPPYVVLLAFITLVNYFTGIGVDRARDPRLRRLIFISGISISLGLLGYYKYTGWILESLNSLAAFLYLDIDLPRIDPVLPVGISFFTFQALSYSIDIYRGRIKPVRSLLDFTCFVSFFPQLVAGPIVRSREFLPQIPKHRPLIPEQTIRGIELALIGYFKKTVIADNLAGFVDSAFAQHAQVSGFFMWFGVFCFAVQIYCDFSGYSDIARGLGRIAGFDIPENFRWPYLTLSIRDFWRRWHMTLSFWIRDYIYIPLGGSKVKTDRWIFNMIVTWGLCGLWHGANATFVFWGLYYGVLMVFERLMEGTSLHQRLAKAPELLKAAWTFFLVMLGWVLFRSPNLKIAVSIYGKMFSINDEFFADWLELTPPLALISLAAGIHLVSHVFNYDVMGKSLLLKLPLPVRVFLIAISTLIIILFAGRQESFIYFAF